MDNHKNSPAILVNRLGKQYRKTLGVRRVPYQTLRETIMGVVAAPVRRFRAARERPGSVEEPGSDYFWALRDVSFEVAHGQAVGIVGRNGAGKTTLLRLLSRITEPTQGWAEMYGRVGALLEVGAGFHQELSGRENVFLNGAILGMSKREVESKFEEIVAFAEVQDFIDTQVKHYSSGMYMRLAFSVAAHLEPDILLIDEVLAVGDAAFQAKCLGKMSDVAKGGRTVLFVSHNMAAINALCERAVWIDKGRIMQIGPTIEVTEACIRRQKEVEGAEQRIGYGIDVNQVNARRAGFAVTDIQLSNPSSPGIGSRTGDPLELTINYHSDEMVVLPAFIVIIKDLYGQELIRLATSPMSGFKIDRLHPDGRVRLSIERLPLVASHYLVDIELVRPGIESIAKFENLIEFDVELFDYYGHGDALDRSRGVLVVDHVWGHEPLPAGSASETLDVSDIG
jgi:lipopolysaccharide transport system ATP-binding protein